MAPLCRLGDAHMGLMEIQQQEAKGPATRGATNGGAGGGTGHPLKICWSPQWLPTTRLSYVGNSNKREHKREDATLLFDFHMYLFSN